jgi:transposase-like protein
MSDGVIRSQPCPHCGSDAVWTQNAWTVGDTASAAYVCGNGHVIDPRETRQCPKCGVHDTSLLGDVDGRQQFRCAQCGEVFVYPRDIESAPSAIAG